ncbi:uncharacterized protein [Dermacentor andersoni]|uniref:uncharacterized protein isoform X2 n=1 Tax=Dermacentor andersoni TaxID=34620 RepID=UPI003B3A5C2D
MEKVVLGIKIKVVFFILIQLLSIYRLTTWDTGTSKGKLKDTPKKARMHKDSWSLGPRTILQKSFDLLPGPKLLESLDPGAIAAQQLLAKTSTTAGTPLSTKNPDQEKRDKEFEKEVEKTWAEYKIFVIYRLGIFTATLEEPPP